MGTFSHGHALVVGIANYPNAPKLPEVVLDDAADLVNVLHDPELCGYPREQVHHLSDAGATAEAILAALEQLARDTTDDSTAFIFFSGHGWREEGNGSRTTRHYLVAHDARLDEDHREGLIGEETLTEHLREIRAGRLVVLLDCCHAAGAGELKSFTPPHRSFKTGLGESYYERLGHGKGRVFIASSKADEFSHVLPGMRNSLFTHYLLDALRGQAANPKGEVGIFEVFNFVSDGVSKHVRKQKICQKPVMKVEIEDNFAIALGKAPPQPLPLDKSVDESLEKSHSVISITGTVNGTSLTAGNIHTINIGETK